jgi:hypothetical protein
MPLRAFDLGEWAKVNLFVGVPDGDSARAKRPGLESARQVAEIAPEPDGWPFEDVRVPSPSAQAQQALQEFEQARAIGEYRSHMLRFWLRFAAAGAIACVFLAMIGFGVGSNYSFLTTMVVMDVFAFAILALLSSGVRSYVRAVLDARFATVLWHIWALDVFVMICLGYVTVLGALR